MNLIEVSHLTKDYGHGRGVFDVSFEVKKGETLGFLGPNGAGKSTTMRHLMGFSRPQSGETKILGKDCFSQYGEIKKHIGYLPGEVNLPDGLNGWGFIEMMKGLRGVKSSEKLEYLLEKFQLDPSQNVKEMSIGEKRKLAVVTAFMADPEILLLDEPTSGLDPVMQTAFIDFVREEKAAGKTILLSSHIFAEVDAVCDRIAIIKDGRIVSVVSAKDVKHGLRKTFILDLRTAEEYRRFLKEENFEIVFTEEDKNKIAIVMEDNEANAFLSRVIHYDVARFDQHSPTLESYFMEFYKNDKKFGGVTSGRNH